MSGFMVRCELVKVIAKRSNRLVLAGLAVVALVFSWLAITSIPFVDEAGVKHTDWQSGRQLIAARQQHAGPITPERVREIVHQQGVSGSAEGGDDAVYSRVTQPVEDIIFLTSSMLLGDKGEYDPQAILGASDEQIVNLYPTYQAHIQEVINEYGTTPEKRAFLNTQFARIELPLVYEPTSSWQTMVYYATILSLVLVVGIGFVCSGLMTDELQGNTDLVYFSTYHSRFASIVVKLGIGLGCATAIYWTGIGVLTAACLGAFGMTGIDSLYQLDQSFSMYTYSWGTIYLMVVGFGYLAALITAAVVMAVSAFTKQRMFAIALPFLLFFVSPFIGRAMPFKTFFSLTPDQLLNVINLLKIPNIYQLGDHVLAQTNLLAWIYGLVVPVLLLVAFGRFRSHGLVST